MATEPATASATTKGAEAPPVDELGSDVARRVAELRDLAERSPIEARDETWRWFQELGKEAASDREGGTARLNELFALGTPPAEINGQTEGILVVPLIAGPVDFVVRNLTSAWMPWLGKRFDRAAGTGDNVLASSARWPAKLFWPLYGTWSVGSDRGAFEFETRVEEGKDDPGLDVLVIDYAPVESNPRLIIRSIRDELVQIVPGANLGKILWRRGEDSYSNIGFFALRTDPS
jgi:hypothetical protein